MTASPGLLIIGVAELAYHLTGGEYPEVLWSLLGNAVPTTGFLCAIYYWFGLPGALRPPAQRGWEIVDGDLKKVRPGAPADV